LAIDPTGRYLEALAARLREVLRDRLRGVYASGSVALGAFVEGRSDVDVIAVIGGRPGEAELRELAAACSHSALPCPARKLELVVYDAVTAAAGRPDWLLNLNTGAGMDDHVGLDPSAEPRHWFVLDLALASEHGIALAGPPARETFEAPPLEAVRAAQADAVAWYAHNEPGPGVLAAAARAWFWEDTGRFASKAEALRWACAHLGSAS
jgi:hypothetical protein